MIVVSNKADRGSDISLRVILACLYISNQSVRVFLFVSYSSFYRPFSLVFSLVSSTLPPMLVMTVVADEAREREIAARE